MKVLILGSDGFIGSHLRDKHISLGDDVICIDKSSIRSSRCQNKYTFFNQCITYDNYRTLKLYSHHVDFVYNCIAVATPSYYVSNPIDTFHLDFEINKNIIDIIHESRTPFIHFSSSEVYGKTWTEPYTEESNCTFGAANKQRWIYATSKLLLDQYILASKMNCCILRPFNFCGHDIDWLPDINNNQNKYWIPRLPACFLNDLFNKKPLTIVMPGSQRRCYTYIDDAIDGILSVVKNFNKCYGEILNIGNKNNEISIDNVAYLFNKIYYDITGINTNEIDYISGEKFYGIGYEDSERRLFSDDKMVSLTKWKPKINIEDTIRLTIKNALKSYKGKI